MVRQPEALGAKRRASKGNSPCVSATSFEGRSAVAPQMISPPLHVKVHVVNKRLESLIDRIPTWPQEAQDWAALALAEVEEKVRILQSLTPEDRSKLEVLRDTINRSIERGGSYTDEEVAAYIEQLHAEHEGR